jgi:hypothetical protein
MLGALLLSTTIGLWYIRESGKEAPPVRFVAPPATAAPAPATGSPAPSPPATVPPGTPGTGTPTPDARFVEAGQCVRNEGDQQRPALVIADCAAGTYEVLKRIDASTTGRADAELKCAEVTGYTDWYFFDSPLDTLDYVLCLRSH